MLVHKSYIVRMDEVVCLHVRAGTRYELELRSGLRLPIGRSCYVAARTRTQLLAAPA